MRRKFDATIMSWRRDLHRKFKKPKKSPVEGQALNIAGQDQARSVASQDTAQGTLSQFEGPVQSSPFYKALEKSGVESTSNAYQNVRANMRSRASATGFGNNNQPIEQAGETQVDTQEAKALADVPNKALVEATGPALQAAGTTAGIGATQGGQGADYFKSAIPLEQQYQDQLFKQQQAMWNAISQVPQDLMMASAGGD